MTGSVGFLLHPGEEGIVESAVDRARQLGLTTWSIVRDPERAIADYVEGAGLLVTVGGDGTFLLGARLAAPHGIPVLGVNRGRLGFLTDVEVSDLDVAIQSFASGAGRIERRTLLEVRQANSDPAAGSLLALNDVIVKSPGVAASRIRVESDGDLLGEFDADGVVVATSTGSTAYALSAGGPLIDPRVRALAVVPLAPHAVVTRAVVLPEAVSLRVTVQRGRAIMAADGQMPVDLGEHGAVEIQAGPELRLFRLATAPSFLSRLREKFRFGVPVKGIDHPAR